MSTLKIFIGFDSREHVAYHVLSHSIITRASSPVSITPLVRSALKCIYTRERGPTESTEFSLTRFLVPYLSDYDGISVFMDCDMLCRVDICQVMNEISLNNAVSVCQHNYLPTTSTKFLGQIQTCYTRKNWSSFMVFNNQLCRALTPEYVNSAHGLDLHGFKWVEDDRIGSLDLRWNWLVGEYPANYDARILHYTLGGPWFDGYQKCDHADEWFSELEMMSSAIVTRGVYG